MSLMSMIWIPLYAAYYLITEPGTLKQVGTVHVLRIYREYLNYMVYDIKKKHKKNSGRCKNKTQFFFKSMMLRLTIIIMMSKRYY